MELGIQGRPNLYAVAAVGLLAAVTLACGPAWLWAHTAWGAPGYSGAGRWAATAACLAMIAILIRVHPQRPAGAWLAGAGLAMATFGWWFHDVPRPLSCVLAASALAMAWLAVCPPERGERWGIAALLLFSLPLGVGADLVLGFPLRVLVTQLSAAALGPQVHAVGTSLSGPEGSVLVDAPCAGVRMLAVGVMLAAALAALLRAGLLQTVLLLAAGAVLTVLGNAARAVGLYLLETSGEASTFLHDAVGISVFVCSTVALVMVSSRLPRWRAPWRLSLPLSRSIGVVLLCGGMALAATAPGGDGALAAPTTDANEPVQWPAEWQGMALLPLPPQPGMEQFLSGFPGAMQEFAWGDSSTRVLLRSVNGATRALHPPQLCYSALGWRCETREAYADAQGHVWSSFTAERNGEILHVREAYFSVPEQPLPHELDDALRIADSWPDYASWYWSAALPGSTTRRTLAITVSGGVAVD